MKIKKITSLAIVLLSVCSCSNEKNYFGDTYEINTTISFDQLLDIAVEPKEDKTNNYTLKYTSLGSDYDAYEPVSCLNSELYVCREIYSDTYSLRRINGTDVIATNLNDFIIQNISNSPYIKITGNITSICDYRYPIVIYTKTTITSDYQLVIADCYGATIQLQSVSDSKKIWFSDGEEINGIHYFYIDIGNDSIFFKYRVDNNRYNVSVISEDEYDEETWRISSNTNTNNELSPVYDREGEIFAYTFENENTFNVYDKDKRFLNAVNLNSFGLRNYDVRLFFEKKVVFFVAESYYDNVAEKSSEQSYKCKCLQIDFSNGEVSYDDDFKYRIIAGDATYYDDKYQYTIFYYYELNSKRELGSVLLCSIAKENLSFNNSFVFDGFDNNAYLLDKKTVLCSFNSKFCICTKNERKFLNDITSIKFISNNRILFQDKEGKYYACDRSNFVSYVDSNFSNNSLVSKYDYISRYRFYGDYIKLSYDKDKDKYYCNNLAVDSKYLSYINYGLLINDSGINYFKGAIYTATNDTTIINVSSMFTLNNTTFFKLELSNYNTQYFIIESVKA